MPMMSPDPEQQGHPEEVELVQQNVSHCRTAPRRRRSRRANRNPFSRSNAAGNGYHEVDDTDDDGYYSHSLNSSMEEYHDDDNYHDEDDEDSAEGLISSHRDAGSSVGGSVGDDYLDFGLREAGHLDLRCAFWIVFAFLLVMCLAIILPNRVHPIVKEDGSVRFSNGTTISPAVNKTKAPPPPKASHFVALECPGPTAGGDVGGENFHNTSVEQVYKNKTKLVEDLIENNFTSFLATFRSSEFDGWGKTYDFVKAGMYHWKSTRFPKNLNDGDTIYESACGIGLNLVMTLEILQEVKGVTNLTVYGNEYLNESAVAGNKILDVLLPDLNATKGTLCTADSTNLHYIPKDSFDLVFTGYISTLLDPLDLGISDIQASYKNYEEVCAGVDWKDKTLAEVAQQRQNDWFGTWVREMVRIAKPGAPVIIEQVSYPFCEATFDWGGVGQGFWKDEAVHEKYKWDIDPASVEFEDDRIFRRRYHVFMRKRSSKTLLGANKTTTYSPEPTDQP